MVLLSENTRDSARQKMLQVPSVTMNGGSRRSVTSSAVDHAAGGAGEQAQQANAKSDRHAEIDREPAHHHRATGP